MKLIGSHTSPFVRKILIILLEKGLDFEFIQDNPWEKDPVISRYNPLGKIPALITSTGEVFYDSPIIAEYLDLLSAQPQLIPTGRQQALPVRQLESLADGLCDAAVWIRQEQMRPISQQNSEFTARQQEKIYRGLDALESAAQQAQWLNGSSITLADIAAGCCIDYIDFRQMASDWHTHRPTLVKLLHALRQRESFIKTRPPVA